MSKSISEIKPTHKVIKTYYQALELYRQEDAFHEGAVRSAFQNLLADVARKRKWILIPELSETVSGNRVVPDGTIRDQFHMPRGYWEAKDSQDNLKAEIQKKLAKGYPTSNIIFEDTLNAVLYQNGEVKLKANLTNPNELIELIHTFFAYEQPNIIEFEKAVEQFSGHVKDLATGLKKKIDDARTDNKDFIAAYEGFFKLCKNSLNPNISHDAVDEMLIQHLLTERLFRTIIDNREFTNRNVIAVEVEKVIKALVKKSFSRKEFLSTLDRFYIAIERAAHDLDDFSEKQRFLNDVYEQFFRGYSVKVADTHGIVYTPQPIVEFMCNSVIEVLKNEFGRSISDPDVHILDPCTGTGNFIVNLIKKIPKKDLPRMYENQLYANEVMLMPYYIAAMNIEHAYLEQTGEYKSFDGICFVDTLDLADSSQTEMAFMTEENTQRIERQRKAPITVIIGNPPYNMGQVNENDNNKNRPYDVIDGRIRQTYSKDSNAKLKNKLYDPYVKFFRWATDRLEGRDGIVCFVSNNSFVENIAFDGMRNHLLKDFDHIYHIDLHGNVRKNPKLSGTTHNVFGIQVGVGITILIRKMKLRSKKLFYHRAKEYLRKEEKYRILIDAESNAGVKWQKITPNEKNSWLIPESSQEFSQFVPIGFKYSGKQKFKIKSLINIYSTGANSGRDSYVFFSNANIGSEIVIDFIENYNSEVSRFERSDKIRNIDNFVNYEKIKWSSTLKQHLSRCKYIKYNEDKFRSAIYRPFYNKLVYYDSILFDRPGKFGSIYGPFEKTCNNIVICLSGVGSSKPFQTLIISTIPCLDLLEKTQCFPFYTYNEDGTDRKENITDWALDEFRKKYKDKKISKEDIFYYIYGLLHHPGYREKYADCLRRELPRIPYAPDFHAYSKAGKKLAKWHLSYETIEPYKLEFIETEDIPLSYKIEGKMRLNRDKTELKVNDTLTLAGIPAKVYEYRLGNRSALDWVIDQYRVKEDRRSGIVSDPNNPDDPEYIVRLVGQVIRVSLETVDLVSSLPKKFE